MYTQSRHLHHNTIVLFVLKTIHFFTTPLPLLFLFLLLPLSLFRFSWLMPVPLHLDFLCCLRCLSLFSLKMVLFFGSVSARLAAPPGTKLCRTTRALCTRRRWVRACSPQRPSTAPRTHSQRTLGRAKSCESDPSAFVASGFAHRDSGPGVAPKCGSKYC